MTTPAGWYPDPSAPGTERWWDGTAWSARTRPTQSADEPAPPAGGFGPSAGGFGPPAGEFGPPAAGFGPPTAGQGPPSTGFGPPTAGQGQPSAGFGPLSDPVSTAPPRNNRGRWIALITAAAVLATATTVVLLTRDDGSGEPAAAPTTTAPTAPPTSAAPTPSPEPSASGAPDLLTDQLNGISMPVPDGWEKSSSSLDEGATMYTDLTYECPGGGSSLCRRGRVSSLTATRTDVTSPAVLARQDITTAVDKAYGEDPLGRRIYGGISSQTEVRSQSVAVAGRTGHLVRRRVVTGSGPGGYVQSLVFPAPKGAGSLVIVRFAFDAGPGAPTLAEMDRIMASIRPIGDATSGGVGSSIGP
ncbi:DUF2510 domain-containing protein [Streptomyces sp. NPDC051018]|uniref:DUF2510 domain-containing protein n=1 Tax=Streptomyces sp. NPDC051018 TaxID=3365639 RepID=UPI00379E3B6A